MRPGGRVGGTAVALGLMLAVVAPARAVVWTGQPTAVAGFMYRVSCGSAGACTAVGEVGYKGPPGAMQWDGRRWRQESVPNPGPPPDSADSPEGLTGLSCTSSTACTAVGSYDDAVGDQLPMAVRWDGSGWSPLPAPSLPSGDTGGGVQDVSCLSNSACMAVGEAGGGSGVIQPLADWWNGSGWSPENLPAAPGPGFVGLTAVSCTSGGGCTAVGDSTSDGLTRPLAERWNGSRWTLERLPWPRGVTGAVLSHVSCPSPTVCVAVGSYTASKGGSGTLIERWNGLGWSAQSTAGDFRLNDVSCNSSGACTAVGDSQDPATSAYGAVVERWDGSGWRLSRPPGAGGLSAVSCWSGVRCTALSTAGGDVTAYRSAPASATLTGVPTGCVSTSVTVIVTGLGISSVTWSLGSQRLAGGAIRRGSRYTAHLRPSPGRHELTVTVKFQPYSDARPRIFRRSVVGCPAGH